MHKLNLINLSLIKEAVTRQRDETHEKGTKSRILFQT